MEDEAQKAVRALDSLAEQRRHEMTAKVAKSLPAGIRRIDLTEVQVTMHPLILPYRQVDPSQLISLLETRYRLKFRRPRVAPGVSPLLGVDESKLSDTRVLEFLLASIDNYSVHFEEGRFPTGERSFVKVNLLEFTNESIRANVAGPTDVAEVLVPEAFEILWTAAGARKDWDAEDVQARVQLKTYGTDTKVDFGVDLLALLSPATIAYLKSNIGQGHRFGGAMMSRSAFDRFEFPTEFHVAFGLDRLDIDVRLFNIRTGRAVDAKIRIDVTQRDEFGRGVASVITQMPFDKHVEFVQGLIAAANSSGDRGQRIAH